MQVLAGILFHFLGGFASGSFYIPFKRVKGWAWESYWLVGGLFSWLIVPPVVAWISIPGFAEMIAQTPASTLGLTYFFGVLWGIGGLTYGLGVRYLGVSLGSSIILGLCMVFGAIIPSIYYEFFPEQGKDTIGLLFGTRWGLSIMAGLLVCILGIIICGRAGMQKEKELKEAIASGDQHGLEVKVEYRFGLGMLVSVVSGVLSACFNFGLEAGKPLAEMANAAWQAKTGTHTGNYLFMNNITYVVVLWGGLTTNLIWCLLLNTRNKTFGDYTNKATPLVSNYLFSALAGTTWFLQFFFYGMGESRLGNGASSWILHMAFIILVANMWGLILREWSGVKRSTLLTIIAGILTIIFSVMMVSWGNALKP